MTSCPTLTRIFRRVSRRRRRRRDHRMQRTRGPAGLRGVQLAQMGESLRHQIRREDVGQTTAEKDSKLPRRRRQKPTPADCISTRRSYDARRARGGEMGSADGLEDVTQSLQSGTLGEARARAGNVLQTSRGLCVGYPLVSDL